MEASVKKCLHVMRMRRYLPTVPVVHAKEADNGNFLGGPRLRRRRHLAMPRFLLFLFLLLFLLLFFSRHAVGAVWMLSATA